jgi:hypothetical protein
MLIDGERWRLYSLKPSEVGSRFDEAKIRESERMAKAREESRREKKQRLDNRLNRAVEEAQDNLSATRGAIARNHQMISKLDESNAKLAESLVSLNKSIKEANELLTRGEQEETSAEEESDEDDKCSEEEETNRKIHRTNLGGGLEKHLPSGKRGAGLDDIFRSEKERKRKREESLSVPRKNLKPKFAVGDKVYVWCGPKGLEKWRMGVLVRLIVPTEGESLRDDRRIIYRVIPIPRGEEVCRELSVAEDSLRDRDWSPPENEANSKGGKEDQWDQDGSSCLVSNLEPLHPLNVVGIDTCSAMSVSTRREDFLYIDSSSEARSSVVLRGVGGNNAAIQGRGPMVVKAHDDQGFDVLLIDPSGVLLADAANQAGFRIFGQQRLKKFGFNLVQDGDGNGIDHLMFKNGAVKIPLKTEAGILTLATYPLELGNNQMEALNRAINDMDKDEDTDHCLRVVSSSLILNEAHLTSEERERLLHWRTAHRLGLKSKKDKHGLNENCVICDEGKRKVSGYKRNFEFMGVNSGPLRPYWRMYCDGYGGQGSMGIESYEGAKGGFVFACPTGSVKQRLYGSTKQFPAILYQVLQEVETAGYVCREIYVDTFSVNLSKAAEEVAAMFRVRIIPISAGTPQELAYAESAVRVVGQMSRTLMAGATHLPKSCWGLADLYAVYLHDLLGQKKLMGRSPFEFRNGREPDFDVFFVHVFGCPCQYAPMSGPDHKRAPKTEWGYFVGVQWPMVLVLRIEDEKILSVSRHKVHCHEEAYARYDPTSGKDPLATFGLPKINLETTRTTQENLETIKDYKKKYSIPDHVLSVKCLSDFRRNAELNEPLPNTEPTNQMRARHTAPTRNKPNRGKSVTRSKPVKALRPKSKTRIDLHNKTPRLSLDGLSPYDAVHKRKADEDSSDEDSSDLPYAGYSIHHDKYEAAVALQPPNYTYPDWKTSSPADVISRRTPQHDNPGEENYVNEESFAPVMNYDEVDSMLEEIKSLNMSLKRKGKSSKIEKLRQALTQTLETGKNVAVSKNQLRRKRRKSKSEIGERNVLAEKRKRGKKELSEPVPSPFKMPEEQLDWDAIADKAKQGIARRGGDMGNGKKLKMKFTIFDRVRTKTTRFGRAYAKGKAEYTYGTIMKIRGKVCEIQWDGEEEGHLMKSHTDFLEGYGGNAKASCAMMALYRMPDPSFDDTLNEIRTILPVLEVGSALAPSANDEIGNVPKDFFEALVREDWRDWVLAVKTEIDSWSMFEAATVVPYESMESGASVIPLGELFSVKRNGKKKFRQYAMGNLLKEGKDFGETFSSTVSGDGLRWFCSLAVTCRKEIRGWDAQTGYLQCEQRVAVYSYLPSHHGLSDLTFEQLGPLRLRLMEVIKDEGIKGLKKFASTIRRDRRDKPDEVFKLNKSIYGIPDAGQSFSMFMVGLHLKHCKMVQAEMDPCVFYRITEDEKGNVSDFILVITWVDDCRYFGTERFVAEYEAAVKLHCKCTLEGKSSEFVSIEIKHDVERGVLELTQCEYWIKAIARFAEFLPPAGPSERKVPLSPADEKLLIEPSEEEMKLASHLPYASLLGVCQYPSSFSRIEMRYAMSVLSRHRTKWGVDHFRILLKALEYGYSTREMGIRYTCGKDKDKRNKLIGFADSSFTLPRSQGCRAVMMNGAAISFTSKRHTTTDESTTAAELTEAYLLACDVEGFRTLNEEIGLKQMEPTVLWQDNQSAIRIAMNRGSLAKKTRAMEVRVLSIRNKVEDMRVVPQYLETTKMIADIGTKSLDPRHFCELRDKLCGYAAWEDELG